MKNVKNKYVDILHICIFLFNKEKQMIVENHFPNKIENMTENVVYIWEVVTKKNLWEEELLKSY